MFEMYEKNIIVNEIKEISEKYRKFVNLIEKIKICGKN